ncbi:MAG: response regulator transcription factor [Peptococcaceae bacterium]|jgi:two-component system alkaline phosphatase synthesis response regulator PhoP|nr:response regulator transcription factor [Peptococcaceae bacterium]
MLYIVEDDANIRQMESYALKNSGFEVAEFANAAEFWRACETQLPELLLLDIMLPGEDGFALLQKLRNQPQTHDIPVIIVTAKSTEVDAVRGLENGADDYITKPFGIIELVARVKVVLRRIQKPQPARLQAGQIVLDDDKRQVLANGKECSLTFKEYELLKLLLLNSGIVLSRERIMDKVWGTDFEGESRTVDMHIKTLRQKLGESGASIKTVRNVGYKIE